MWQTLLSDTDNIQEKPARKISLMQLSASSTINQNMPGPEIQPATEKKSESGWQYSFWPLMMLLNLFLKNFCALFYMLCKFHIFYT